MSAARAGLAARGCAARRCAGSSDARAPENSSGACGHDDSGGQSEPKPQPTVGLGDQMPAAAARRKVAVTRKVPRLGQLHNIHLRTTCECSPDRGLPGHHSPRRLSATRRPRLPARSGRHRPGRRRAAGSFNSGKNAHTLEWRCHQKRPASGRFALSVSYGEARFRTALDVPVYKK